MAILWLNRPAQKNDDFIQDATTILDDYTLSAVVTEKLNAEFSLEIKIAPGAPSTFKPRPGDLISAPVPGKLQQQGFRIERVKRGEEGEIALWCPHIFYDLNYVFFTGAYTLSSSFAGRGSLNEVLRYVLNRAEQKHVFSVGVQPPPGRAFYNASYIAPRTGLPIWFSHLTDFDYKWKEPTAVASTLLGEAKTWDERSRYFFPPYLRGAQGGEVERDGTKIFLLAQKEKRTDFTLIDTENVISYTFLSDGSDITNQVYWHDTSQKTYTKETRASLYGNYPERARIFDRWGTGEALSREKIHTAPILQLKNTPDVSNDAVQRLLIGDLFDTYFREVSDSVRTGKFVGYSFDALRRRYLSLDVEVTL